MAGSETSIGTGRHLLARGLATLGTEPAAEWIGRCERWILAEGHPPEPADLAFCRKLGIPDPEGVRFLACREIPVPGRRWATLLGHSAPGAIGGLAARRGIFLHPRLWASREVRAHELVHVAQYHRLGTRPFLWNYIYQCVLHGYENAPLELEAVEGSRGR